MVEYNPFNDFISAMQDLDNCESLKITVTSETSCYVVDHDGELSFFTERGKYLPGDKLTLAGPDRQKRLLYQGHYLNCILVLQDVLDPSDEKYVCTLDFPSLTGDVMS